MSAQPPNPEAEQVLRQLEVVALNFAYQSINIAYVRSEYVRRAQEVTASLRMAYRTGEMSAKAAAEAAHGMRNALLDMQRRKSASVGRALAIEREAKGLMLDEVLIYSAQKQFGRAFAELDDVQQTFVYLKVVDAAGRARAGPTTFAARAGAAGRAVFLLGIGIAAYNIANAEDPQWQAGREASNIAGGLGGSLAAGAVAGIWLGPIGVGIGALVGGVAGALLADQAYTATAGGLSRSVDIFAETLTRALLWFSRSCASGLAMFARLIASRHT